MSEMPTELGQPYKVDWAGTPPHMLMTDLPVWKRFQEKFGSIFKHFYFDVKVGGPDISLIKADPAIAYMWWELKAKKIDVIAEKEDEIWIIEVATRPGLRAVGQILSYRALWALDPKIEKIAQYYLVSDTVDSDLEFSCLVNGIRVLLV